MKQAISITGPDGTTYPSATKAAKALGMTRQTLIRHLERFGSLDNLGKLTGTRVSVSGPDGTVYASKADAARALGVDVATISRHIEAYGNLDLIGTATVPCVWRGKTYPSISAAAKAIGVKPHVVSYHLARHGNLDRAGRGYDRPFGQQRAAKSIRVGPLQFTSIRKAARALGVSEASFYRMTSGKVSTRSRDRLMAKAMALHTKQARASKQWQVEEAF